ncbi:MAG TPA: triose-phosphate isomerase, partial [Verrucomicrobiales bacterium]|nr:triose-phosphate isomerase [Verrucomicrobiales bacterium]
MNRKPIIAANWKMNKTATEAVEFIEKFENIIGGSSLVDIAIAPAFIALPASKELLINSATTALAAQNCHFEESGAFTGEISIGMLKDIGVDYVIIGHSERRAIFGEDDALINAKAKSLHASGVNPIFCIGETLEERDGGEIESVLRRQLEDGLKDLDPENMLQTVIAYEPVWAIGTGKTAKPEEAQEIHSFLRNILDQKQMGLGSLTRILYGGSVNV